MLDWITWIPWSFPRGCLKTHFSAFCLHLFLCLPFAPLPDWSPSPSVSLLLFPVSHVWSFKNPSLVDCFFHELILYRVLHVVIFSYSSETTDYRLQIKRLLTFFLYSVWRFPLDSVCLDLKLKGKILLSSLVPHTFLTEVSKLTGAFLWEWWGKGMKAGAFCGYFWTTGQEGIVSTCDWFWGTHQCPKKWILLQSAWLRISRERKWMHLHNQTRVFSPLFITLNTKVGL